MRGNILFYIVFISQIYLLSYYFPKKILGRMKSVLKTYPPSKYPKLYPRPVEYYQKGQWGFKLVSQAIFLLGLVILFLIIFVVDHANFADDGYISEFWPAVYGIIQFLPLMYLEFSEFNQFKLMRKANSSTTRIAELQPRRFADFASPLILGLAVFLYITTIAFDLYVHDFVFAWGHDTIQRAIVLTVTNLFLAAVGMWNLYGRKLDPYQAFADRAKQITVSLKSMIFVSMALSIYFMTAAADDVFDMDFLDATLLSLYFQVIALASIGQVLRSLQLENTDFEVYKDDVSSIRKKARKKARTSTA